MQISVLTLVFGLVTTFSSFGDGHVKVGVTLKPAGSFEAVADHVQGQGRIFQTKEGGFKAQNVILPLQGLTSHMALRDQHMKEKYLQVETHPNATLVSATAQNGQFTGQMTLHGTTHEVSGTYTLKDGNYVATFKLKPSDYHIAKASYMGVGVQDELEIEVSFPKGEIGPAPGTPQGRVPQNLPKRK